MFAIGVVLALPPLREAFVQLGSAVGIASSSASGKAPSLDGSGSAAGPANGGAGPASTSSSRSSAQPTACASPSSSAAAARSAKASKPVKPSASPQGSQTSPAGSSSSDGTSGSPASGSSSVSPSGSDSASATGTASATSTATATASSSSADRDSLGHGEHQRDGQQEGRRQAGRLPVVPGFKCQPQAAQEGQQTQGHRVGVPVGQHQHRHADLVRVGVVDVQPAVDREHRRQPDRRPVDRHREPGGGTDRDDGHGRAHDDLVLNSVRLAGTLVVA